MPLKRFGQYAIWIAVLARQPTDLRTIESGEATAIDNHRSIGANGSLKDDRIDVNAFLLMAAAKSPMDGSCVIGAMIAPLAAKGRDFRIVADADLTELANIIQIFFNDAAKHVGFFTAFDGDDAAMFHVVGYWFLVG